MKLKELFLDHVGQTSEMPIGWEIERAEGIYMYSPDGKRYTDLVSGVCVSGTGHCNQVITDAVAAQMSRYSHLMVYGELVEAPQVSYAQRLTSFLPESLSSVYFVNSGSEAVEGALKLAKRYTGRTELISCKSAYHGSSHGALSMMGDEYFRNSFRPLLPDTRMIEFGEVSDLKRITKRTACVLIEPIQGEGGVRMPDHAYLRALRSRCTEVGALLIFDEIQTAFGRTGKLFALEHSGVVPDILCLAKALGGGLPLGAFISSKEIMGTLKSNPPLGHITTFGGHPVCCAAGMAAFNYLIDNDITASVKAKGARFKANLSTSSNIKEIRQFGLMIAVDFHDATVCEANVHKLLASGLMTESFLFSPTALRISPPLVITNDQIDEICAVVNKVINNC